MRETRQRKGTHQGNERYESPASNVCGIALRQVIPPSSLNGNTVPITAWAVAELFQDYTLLAEVRSEVLKGALNTETGALDPQRVVNPSAAAIPLYRDHEVARVVQRDTGGALRPRGGRPGLLGRDRRPRPNKLDHGALGRAGLGGLKGTENGKMSANAAELDA